MPNRLKRRGDQKGTFAKNIDGSDDGNMTGSTEMPVILLCH